MKKILCIGVTPACQRILIFDEVHTGHVNRACNVHIRPAGKGANVAIALHALGGTAVNAAFVGGANGKSFISMMERHSIQMAVIETEGETRYCQTLIDQKTGQVTELVEEAPSPSEEQIEQFHQLVIDQLKSAAMVVIAGNLPPCFSEDTYARMISAAADTGVPVLLDSSKAHVLQCLPLKPWMVKMNQHELEATLNLDAGGPDEWVEGASELLHLGAQNVLITAGEKGAWLINPDEVVHFASPRVETVNPIGCGDSVSAGIAFAFTKPFTVRDCCRFGVACGAANAMTMFPAEINPHAVDDLETMVIESELESS